MTDGTIKAPWHLWLVGVIAVLFNSIGAFDHVMSMARGASYMASAGMTPAQIAHYEEMPAWRTAVWTIGVWSAMLGSVHGGEIMGGQMAITSAVITALLLFFMWYSWLMTERSVLR